MKDDTFEADLIVLMKKHDITIKRDDDYDGADEHCGYEYSFIKGDDWYNAVLTIDDLWDKLGGK